MNQTVIARLTGRLEEAFDTAIVQGSTFLRDEEGCLLAWLTEDMDYPS